MAKVTGPLHSSKARGSVGGLTYNTWRSFNTVKARSGPATQHTAAQETARSLGIDAVRSWGTETPETRQAWNDFAAQAREPDWSGSDKRLTGANWYVRCYVHVQWLLETWTAALPIEPLSIPITGLATRSAGGFLHIDWDDVNPMTYAAVYLEVWRADAISPGRKAYVKNALRQDATAAINSTIALPFPPTGVWDYFVRWVHAHGQVSPWETIRWTQP